MNLRLLQAVVHFELVAVPDDDGPLEKVNIAPQVVSAKDWPQYSGHFDDALAVWQAEYDAQDGQP